MNLLFVVKRQFVNSVACQMIVWSSEFYILLMYTGVYK